MPGFFEAFNNLPPPKKILPKVTLDGKEYEVSLELFKEIHKHGVDEFHLQNGEIVMKPRPKAKRTYAQLKKGEKGYLSPNVYDCHSILIELERMKRYYYDKNTLQNNNKSDNNIG